VVFVASKFVISPEPFVQKCKSLAKAKDLHVEVEDGLIRLAWTAFSEDGSTNEVEYFYRAEAVRLGIPYDLFLDA
jgi:hypothetical protein